MAASPSHEQEFVVRLPPKNERTNYHMMKFNQSLNIDTAKWTQVRMVRENNRKEFVREDEMPKFGAGSEFGREQKEEARRKKYGITTRRYNPDAQPWLMRIGSKKEGKQYRGIREGGVSDNTAFFVFTHAQDGSFEAHPIKEWYNFTPRVTYRTLNAEEAEEKFAERGKILNHFAIMVGKKLRPNQDDTEDLDDEGGKGKKGKNTAKEFKVSDMDDWVDSDEQDSDSDGEEKKKKSDDEDEDNGKKKNNRSKDSKKRTSKKKKKKDEDDDEAFEDSDDGDHDGSEVDYMSDESSESEEEIQAEGNIKGVDQDEGLAKMLDSDSSSDEEDKDKKKEEEAEKEKEEETSAAAAGGKKGGKKKKEGADTKGDEKGGKGSTKSSANNSRATTPTPGGSGDAGDKSGEGQKEDEKNVRAEKRKKMVDNLLDPNAEPASKKSRQDPFSSSSSASHLPPPPANSMRAAFEEDVRRYLMRKPMTTTELLKKFKSKKTGLDKDELMPVLVDVLKRLNPHKQKIKGTMYLSLKGEK